ncbi:hypothetical protein IAU60_000904 [Kwoniella sp. DSM 27419]
MPAKLASDSDVDVEAGAQGSRSETPRRDVEEAAPEPEPELSLEASQPGSSGSKVKAVMMQEIEATFANSPSNPYNWPRRKRKLITLCLALTGLISTSGSSIGVPGIHAVMAEYGVEEEKIGVLIAGAYVLGLGTGPFIFAPVSELFGRIPAYYSSQVLYCVFFLGTGFSNHMATLIVLRFFCGVFGSVSPSLGVATCADVWEPSARGKPISIYGLGPIAGPVLGNMVGYWLLPLGWRWAYYFWTIIATLNTVFMIIVMRETYAPIIKKIMLYHQLHPKSSPPQSRRGLNPLRWLPDLSWMRHMVSRSDAVRIYGQAFSRPPRLLFTNPVAFAFSIYYAYVYGVIYVFIVSLVLLFGQPPFSRPNLFTYAWPRPILPLAYIPLGMGFGTAVAVGALYQDRIYKHLSKRNGDKGQPEYRLVLTQTGMVLMPIGLFIFGWTAQSERHWMGPFVGQYLIGLGLMLAFNTLQNFFVDAFYPYSAAAIASATACRSIIACILPLFTSDMFEKLGWGWGGTLLALVAMLGLPCPLIMFVWGKRLRERYAFDG